MKKQIVGYTLLLFIFGCSGFPLKEISITKKNDLIYGSKNNKSGIIIINSTDSKNSLPDFLKNEQVITDVIHDKCLVLDKDENIPIAAMISFGPQILSLVKSENLVSAGIKAVDWYIEKKEKEIERIKEASQVDYSNRVIITPFDNVSCAIVYRYKDYEKVNLVSVLQFQRHGNNAFTLQPLYVKAKDSIAITKKSDAEKCAKMDISFALSLKTVRKDKKLSNFPILIPIGEGIVTVPNIAVGSDTECSTSCREENTCERSDLIPLPLNDEAVSVTFVTTETGKIGLDIDKSLSQMKALRKAIGPILENIAPKE
jgi:hypothetical protein